MLPSPNPKLDPNPTQTPPKSPVNYYSQQKTFGRPEPPLAVFTQSH